MLPEHKGEKAPAMASATACAAVLRPREDMEREGNWDAKSKADPET